MPIRVSDPSRTPKQLADRYFYEQCQRLGPIEGVPAPTWQPSMEQPPKPIYDYGVEIMAPPGSDLFKSNMDWIKSMLPTL